MTDHDIFTLEQLLSKLRHYPYAVLLDEPWDLGDLLLDEAELREVAAVLEIVLAEVKHLRGIARDALEDSVMYQRGVAEGRRLGRRLPSSATNSTDS